MRARRPAECGIIIIRICIRIYAYIVRNVQYVQVMETNRRRPRLSMYARERIWQLLAEGYTCSEVVTALKQEGIHTCRQTVWRLDGHIKGYGTIAPLPKSGRPTKLTDVALQKIDAAMMQDDETTAKELVTSLQGAGVSVSLSTALKGRHVLGWTRRGSAYCQLIRAENRQKRLNWAQEHLGAEFHDVIWTDETSVQMEMHRRFCCRKKAQKPHYKSRPKHPVKVHVWAGISWNGATNACIFEGIMDAELYCQITWYHLYRLYIRTITGLCRTTTQSIRQGEHKLSLLTEVSTGGVRHRSHRMQILLKICGMN